MHDTDDRGDIVYSEATERLMVKSREVTIAWKDVNVFLNQQTNILDFTKTCCNKKNGSTTPMSKHIIKNVSGVARPYEVLAIMGSSGSGKTTLLNVLNFRNRGQLKVHGDIKLNGQGVQSVEKISSVAGYVQQDDLFIGTMKVREHLFFQAMLRMDKHYTKQQRIDRIEEVMRDLNLTKCADTRIGNPERGVKGISGGERRRLAFASEIITNPSVLFADEPTTGLDSFMAISIVECIKNLAKSGKTIIFTIHQPSSELFEMFDQICLMSEGRLAFLGSRMMAAKFFENQGFKSPQNYNPADHFIKTLSISPVDKDKSLGDIAKICDGFHDSDMYVNLEKEISRNWVSQIDLADDQTKLKQNNYKAGIFTQMRWLFWRHMLDSFRDPLQFRVLLIQTIAMTIVYGLVFFRLQMDQEGIQNMNGVLFICLVNTSFGTIFGVVNNLPKEIPVFVREHQNGIYRVLPYYLAKSMVELPSYVAMPILFTTGFYWMTNLNNDVTKFFICSAIVILVAQTALAFGQFLSAIAPANASSTDLAGPTALPFMIFGGYFLNNQTTPKYFLWIRYMSWFSYANEALVINQWAGVKNIKCDTDPTLCFVEGESIIKYLDMKPDNFTYDVLMLIFLIIGWRVMSFLAILIRSYKR